MAKLDLLDPKSVSLNPVPRPSGRVGLKALRRAIQQRSPLGALEVMHEEMGSAFRISFPNFSPVMLAGPEAARFVTVTARDDLRWRMEGEPITILLRHGVLVEDDDSHDALRRHMNPAMHRRMLVDHVSAMVTATDDISRDWRSGDTYDMLPQMREAALLILTDTLFGVDFRPEMQRLWQGILQAVHYISPGMWVLWRGFAHRGYNDHLRQIDAYLYRIIAERRQHPTTNIDLINVLLQAGLSDDAIRDQLMTMLIAGHDTSTATLAWVLYLLSKHPETQAQAQAEIDAVIGSDAPQFEQVVQLRLLEQVLNETLRLYPPIHLGSRIAANDLDFEGYHIPAGMRVLYSIYLTHRDAAHWENPHDFDPSRFATGNRHAPYTFIPFGGGPRNCIGAAFANVEAKVVLARLLQRYSFRLVRDDVRKAMGATLEPRPGVRVTVTRR